MSDDLEPVADAVLRVHDRMENDGAKQVPVERVLDYLQRRYDFRAEEKAAERVASVLHEHHGDLWVMGPRDESNAALPSYVIVPEEMAYTIEKEILKRD